MRTVVLIAAVVVLIVIVAAVQLRGNWFSEHREPHMGHNNEQGKALVQITIPALSDLAIEGGKVFDQNCAICHGQSAVGFDGAGPPLVHIIYEPNHHADMSFQLAVKQGVRQHHWRFGDMPPIEGVSQTDVDAIIAYVRELQRANGIN